MLSVLFNIVMALSVAMHIWIVKKMDTDNIQPRRIDYILIAVYGVVGVLSFSSSGLNMDSNPVEGWSDLILGTVLIGVAIWSFTVYKRLR